MTPGLGAGPLWHWLAAAVVRPLHQQRLWREHEALDGAALRDLGVSRSELGSFQAEADGSAACTRRRCAIQVSAATSKADPGSRQNEAATSDLENAR